MKLFYLLAALFFIPTIINADELRFETRLSSVSVSESIPVKSIIDDHWQGNYEGSTSLFTLNRADIAFGYGHWMIGASARYDYFGRFSEETIGFIYRDKNKLPQPENQVLPVHLDVEHAISQGGFIQYDNTYRSLRYLVRLNGWYSEELLSGNINGELNTNVNEDYTGLLNFDYNYKEDTLFDRLTPDPIEGVGYSLDIELAWQVSDNIELSLKMHDVGHRITWKDVYHTKATLDRTPDKADSAPSLSGIEDTQRYVQRFSQQNYLRMTYQLNSMDVYAGTDHINKQHYPYLGLKVPAFGDSINASIDVYPKLKSVKLGLGSETIGITLGLNKSKFRNSNVVQLAMYLSY